MPSTIMQFENVSFGYQENKIVLEEVSFSMEKGQTYALVGPTGNGKSTTASLMIRLFDPTSGLIKFDGLDLRSYELSVLSKKIGFILQDPFLFSGSLGDNLRFGNDELKECPDQELISILNSRSLDQLLQTFDDGLATELNNNSQNISLGQKQLIAFLRIILRQPEFIILDEATANIDTITENQMQDILDSLPETTTKVIIAHRLNTIENADQIFFINGGRITPAVDFDDAIKLISKAKLSN